MIQITIPNYIIEGIKNWFEKRAVLFIIVILSVISIVSFAYYYENGLGLVYNDARSHLDIGRRVVEGLKPGMAQLGSVWLPLTHFLMIITVWNDFMWHSGLAGALWSMIAFVGTGVVIYNFLKELNASLLSRLVGVLVFTANINILYLQSTAMTELSLLFTMTFGAYYFLRWFKSDKLIYLILAGFWVMLATLIRYDAWFMLMAAIAIVVVFFWFKRGYRQMEGKLIMFGFLAGFGVILWFLWNLSIFKDPLYFAFGPYSAHTQQEYFEAMDMLPTKYNWWLSTKIYFYALAYNSGALVMVLGLLGALVLWLDRNIKPAVRVASVVLIAPLLFNILALYLGHSVLHLAGVSGDTWFNVRYGLMMMPSFAIFIGFLASRLKKMRVVLVGAIIFISIFTFYSRDAITIDDARYGSSANDVEDVSHWLNQNAKDQDGLVLISAASHDSIIFTSGMQMKQFIHEGTGQYYDSAILYPARWARWIIMHSNFENDSTWRKLAGNEDLEKYELVKHYSYVDIYELKDEYVDNLITKEEIEEVLAMGQKKFAQAVEDKEPWVKFSLINKEKAEVYLAEAKELFSQGAWVEMNEKNKEFYDILMRGKEEIDYSVKYKIAYFIQYGTLSTRKMGAKDRIDLLESSYNKKGHFPATVEDWMEMIEGAVKEE